MTRRYWPYFRDSLGYPQIQRPGPLALIAEGAADEMDRLYQAGMKVREQFLPDLAETESVGIHGQSRGVHRHHLESGEQYRTRVINAFPWHRLAGRHRGMYKIFAAYGFPIISLVYLTGDAWAEFDLEVESPAGTGLDQNVFDLIRWMALEYKRAIAMPRNVRLIKRVRGRVRIKAAVAMAERLIIYPPPPELPEPQVVVKTKAAVITHEAWTVYPQVLVRRFKAPAFAQAGIPLSPITRVGAPAQAGIKHSLE